MRQILYTALLFIVAATQLQAQVALPDKCEAFRPKLLTDKYLKERDIKKFMLAGDYGQKNAPTEKKYWIVYSDRSDNKLYSSPNGSVVGSLKFNERVIVAKISGEWALVYDDPAPSVFPLISNKAKAKGWIKMENLLLWDKAMSNDAKIIHKALLVHNMDKDQDYDPKLYTNPATGASNGTFETSVNYYFIFKNDSVNNKVLMAKQSNVNGFDAQLYGWVSGQSYIPWSQRSCIEPNWDSEVITNELKSDSVKIYEDAALTSPYTRYKFGKPNDSIVRLKDTRPERYEQLKDMEYRMKSSALRYPILESKGDIYKCTTFNSIGGELNDDIDNINSSNNAINDMIEKVSTVNLIFVIDGTESMKDYFYYVKQAISDCRYFNQDYTFKVGLVIYRDYPDGEEGLIEYIPVGEKDDKLLNSYLETVGKYGAKSSAADRTSAEALYKGLEVALDKNIMGYKDKENVVFVVIGDCGNDVNDTKSLSQAEIISRMVKNNINLITFQVRRPDLPAYSDFNKQMSKILATNIRQQYKNLGLTSQVPIVKVENGYDLKLVDEFKGHQYMIASMRYAPLNGVMTPQQLAQQLDEQFGQYVQYLKDQMDNINNVVNADKEVMSIDTMTVINKLTGGYNMFCQIKKSRAMLSLTGYTKKMTNGGRDYWKPVAFMSESEFDELLTSLSRLYEVSAGFNRNPGVVREKYVEAMKALTRSLIPGISEQQINSSSVEDVMAMINGLHESSGALKGYTIKDLSMPEKVSDNELKKLINTFRGKYSNLKSIREEYFFTFVINKVKYYWIPIEELP